MGKLDPIRDMFPGIVHDHDLRTIDHLDFDLTCESRHHRIRSATGEVVGSTKDKCTIKAVAMVTSCRRPEGFLACEYQMSLPSSPNGCPYCGQRCIIDTPL